MSASEGLPTEIALPLQDSELGRRRWPVPAWLTTLVVFLILWQAASELAGLNAAGINMVPSLPDLAGATKLLGNYWPGGFGLQRTAAGEALTWKAAILAFIYNSGLTILRTEIGLLSGVVAGVVLAAAVSWSPFLRRTLTFPAHIARMLPLLALVPLFNLWLGDTEPAVLLFVGIVGFCVMFAATLGALGAVPLYYVQFAQSLGLGRLRLYLTVILPAAQPRINVGVQLAHGFAWSAVIAAEFLGMQFGLGRIVLMAREFNQFNLLALAGFITVGWATASSALLTRFLKLMTRWI